MKQLGNVSKKIGHGLVIYSMFNKHRRKFRKRLKPRIKVEVGGDWKQDFVNLLNNYKYHNFCHKLRTILRALPKRLLKIAWDVTSGGFRGGKGVNCTPLWQPVICFSHAYD